MPSPSVLHLLHRCCFLLLRPPPTAPILFLLRPSIKGACVTKSGNAKLEDNKATKHIVALLSAPLEKYNDIVTALNLSNYLRLMDHLNIVTKKAMAVLIIQSITKNNTCVSTIDNVKALFDLMEL